MKLFPLLFLLVAGCAVLGSNEYRLEGWVEKVDKSAGLITVKTAMGQQETLYLDEVVGVRRQNHALTVEDVKPGESVSITYQSLPDKLLVREIAVGYTVSFCSCGSSCTCPLSRGCRVIRY